MEIKKDAGISGNQAFSEYMIDIKEFLFLFQYLYKGKPTWQHIFKYNPLLFIDYLQADFVPE